MGWDIHKYTYYYYGPWSPHTIEAEKLSLRIQARSELTCKLDRVMLSYLDNMMVVQSDEDNVAALPSSALCHCGSLCRSHSLLKTCRRVWPKILVVWGNKNIWKINHPKGRRQCDAGKSPERFWGQLGVCGCLVCHLWGANRKSLQWNICCRRIFREENDFPYWSFEQRFVRVKGALALVAT